MPEVVRGSINRYGMTRTTLTNRLVGAGLITPVAGRTGLYTTSVVIGLTMLRRAQIINRVAVENNGRYYWRASFIGRLDAVACNSLRVRSRELDGCMSEATSFQQTIRAEFTQTPVTPEPLRTITRYGYHHCSRNVNEALQRLTQDADGVKRSFGLEWEIYSLTDTQEDKLARLLDTLPPHATERDSSLSSSGVEIIFEPMNETEFLTTFHKLKSFCVNEGVSMQNTGAHTTYGVSNSRTSTSDLQIRLNRLALAVKAVGTQGNIRRLFGRDFTSYACLPNSTTQCGHSMSFNASRGDRAWECRLVDWKASPEGIVEFLKATEFVFKRPVKASDFIKIFEIMGADTSAA